MIDRVLMAARVLAEAERQPVKIREVQKAAFLELCKLVDDYFAPGRSDSHCRACGAPIIWTKTPAGKNAPLDATPITGLDADGEQRRVYLSHFATCPASAEFKKP